MENRQTAVVRVHRPDLTPEERARRMAEIKKATENLLRATIDKGGKT